MPDARPYSRGLLLPEAASCGTTFQQFAELIEKRHFADIEALFELRTPSHDVREVLIRYCWHFYNLTLQRGRKREHAKRLRQEARRVARLEEKTAEIMGYSGPADESPRHATTELLKQADMLAEGAPGGQTMREFKRLVEELGALYRRLVPEPEEPEKKVAWSEKAGPQFAQFVVHVVTVLIALQARLPSVKLHFPRRKRAISEHLRRAQRVAESKVVNGTMDG
jgi:hypothetical protein